MRLKRALRRAVLLMVLATCLYLLSFLHSTHCPSQQWVKITDNLRSKLTCPQYSVKTEEMRNDPRHLQELTVVSAYFDLGEIEKSKKLTQGKKEYLRWAGVFGRLENPLVFYTDCPEMKRLIEDSRTSFGHATTVVFVEDRYKLWSFQLQSHIKTIFRRLSAPTLPANNDKIPEYSCSQHAKYEVVADAIRRDSYFTEHYAWLDVGYFRDILHLNETFSLELPCNFNSSRVAFNVVNSTVPFSLTPSEIMWNTKFWVGGGFFFGTKSALLKFNVQYRRAVAEFLKMGIMNTDQQVIFSMYSDQGKEIVKPSVDIQQYVHLDKAARAITWVTMVRTLVFTRILNAFMVVSWKEI